jgi:hypothetical protein
MGSNRTDNHAPTRVTLEDSDDVGVWVIQIGSWSNDNVWTARMQRRTTGEYESK